MTPTIRLLPIADADGPTNMARDEALLVTAADHGVASLRFYTWSEPTLTLGYFQPAASRTENAALAMLPWLRRATGGAAIVHHHELTYALALPASRVYQPPGESWICRIHHMFQAILREHGLIAHGVVCGEEAKLGDVLCFLHQTPADLTINGSKVAGSAQRKLRGALLQHGSLLLARSTSAPDLPGINDAAGRELFTPKSLADLISQRFVSETGWVSDSTQWRDDEHANTQRILKEKYGSVEWNERR